MSNGTRLVTTSRSLAFTFLISVVIVPPLVRRSLWMAVGRIFPLLLPTKRGHVEVAPRRPDRFIAARVDEIRPEYIVTLTYERIVTMPLVDAEIFVEVVRDRVPGDQIPAHP